MVVQSVLDDIKSEVQHGRRSERGSESHRANRSDVYQSRDANPHRQLPPSDLSSAIRGQSYGIRPPVIPEHRAVEQIDDSVPLSRHSSRVESTFTSRECADADSTYGSLPSHYGSPTLSISRLATQPIAIPAGQRHPSGASEDPSNSFDGMYGFRSPASQSGQPYSMSSRDRHSTHKDSQEYHRR